MALCALTAGVGAVAATWKPRDVQILGGRWVNRATGSTEVMNGTNIIMKGPPWIPAVSGSTRCNSSTACSTFNELDALYLKSQGWSAVRLGVIWAGGQPTPEPVLDPDFVERLQDFLSVAERHGIRVMLDVHQDAVGTANCGEGVPMWYSQQHFSSLIGKPIVGPKSKLTGNCSTVDFETWGLHAGDPLYNLLNPCCLAWNAPGSWGDNIDVYATRSPKRTLALAPCLTCACNVCLWLAAGLTFRRLRWSSWCGVMRDERLTQPTCGCSLKRSRRSRPRSASS